MTENQLRLRRKPSRRGPIAGIALVAAIAIHSVWGPRTADVQGTPVQARRVVVLRDRSGSMTNTDASVGAQLARLRAAGISVESEITTNGFAISFNSPYSVIPGLTEALSGESPPDTIYVITDFNQGDEEANQPEAFEYMRSRLRGHRLYWAAITKLPPPDYVQLAEQTGGGVIDAR